MALSHVTSGQPISLAPPAATLASVPTSALFKTDQLEVIRVVLPAGKAFPPHQVAGDITVQCLSGAIEFTIGEAHDERSVVLSAGELLYLDGGVRHGLRGQTDAVVLVSIVLRPHV
ncbi:MAG TPA: cupin domain-containing protein [Aquabacterium sp.]|uniref:cupin domain-containing protein n=1 Tax=Aquabacterium sp. TaxID=1872578 RepID=UPI002E374A31|nr:cupin domain-containing protein [Aquabacterium sp.]HEX5356805.1 cupin domain-containing protein [Aquabacterium sp.]